MSLAEKIQSLYSKFGSLKGVTVELHKQLIAIAVKNEAASATVFLQGAQLAEYQRVGERPVLWLSESCEYQAGTALRGGVPVCWPWFGQFERNPEALQQQLDEGAYPAHGFVRNREWQLESIELVDSETTRLILSLNVEGDSGWPYPANLKMIITVGTELRLCFEVKNCGDQTFKFTSALHSYFNISHVDSVTVTGLEGVQYLDTLQEWRSFSSDRPLSVNAEVDRVYRNLPIEVVLNDRRFSRSICLQAENAPDMVVWNPWTSKAKTLTHFPDQAYQQMICLETASVLDNLVTLAPNERHKTALTLSVI